MARYTLTTRISGEVSHDHFDTLDAAFDALARQGNTLQGQADAEIVGGNLMRRYEPEQQVVARVELSGPKRLHLGVDVRGDGSAVPFTGRLMRKQVERRDGETAYDALRRVGG